MSRPTRRFVMRATDSAGRDAGYGIVGYVVIAAVVLLILGGAALLVTMIASSMSSTSPPTTAPQTGTCAGNAWFDPGTGSCLPKAVCEEGEDYVALTNTCLLRPPVIDSLAPTSGLTTGGTFMRILGSGFQQGVTVSIGGQPAVDVELVSDTAITAVTPPNKVTYPLDLEVTNPNGTSATMENVFVYVAPPVKRITEVSPVRGSKDGGEAVIIRGTGFIPGIAVSFGTRPAPNVTVLNPSTLRVITPIGAIGPVTVSVRNPGEQPFPLEDGFTYVDQAPRVVMLVRPADGAEAGGTKITIVGTGFADKATVTLAGRPARKVVVVSSTRITAVTPKGALGPAAVAVRNPGLPAAILADAFTYVEAPTVTKVTPAKGPQDGDTKITITGTGFLAGAKVSVGGAAATSVKVVSPTTITAVTPKGAPGVVPVSVENPDQPVGTLPKAFTYTEAESGGGDPTPSDLPLCEPLTAPATTGAAGAEVLLGASALFPSSVDNPKLAGASISGPGSLVWQASPPRIYWQVAPEPGAVATISFDYTADSCRGIGRGSTIEVTAS